MPRDFNYQARQYAWLNQCPDRSNGTVIVCFSCGKEFDTYYKENKWFAIKKIPTKDRGRFNKENCVLVCGQCYTKIREERGSAD